MSVEAFDLMNQAALAVSNDVRKYMPNLTMCIGVFTSHQYEIQQEIKRVLLRNETAKATYEQDCLKYARAKKEAKELGVEFTRPEPIDHTLCLGRVKGAEDECLAEIQEEVQDTKEKPNPTGEQTEPNPKLEEWLGKPTTQVPPITMVPERID